MPRLQLRFRACNFIVQILQFFFCLYPVRTQPNPGSITVSSCTDISFTPKETTTTPAAQRAAAVADSPTTAAILPQLSVLRGTVNRENKNKRLHERLLRAHPAIDLRIIVEDVVSQFGPDLAETENNKYGRSSRAITASHISNLLIVAKDLVRDFQV